jgi:hypothetical protein
LTAIGVQGEAQPRCQTLLDFRPTEDTKPDSMITGRESAPAGSHSAEPAQVAQKCRHLMFKMNSWRLSFGLFYIVIMAFIE